MPAPHPKEFRDDVVALARKGEVPIAQLAKDFGISGPTPGTWTQGVITRRSAA
jgi:transposase